MPCPSLPSMLPQLCSSCRLPHPRGADGDPAGHYCTLPKPVPVPKLGYVMLSKGYQVMLPGQPNSCWGFPSLSQPRSSSQQGFSPAASMRAGCRTLRGAEQVLGSSPGGCLESPFSSMSHSAWGPGQASCVPFLSLSTHPLPSAILLCSAHPVVLCPLQMPVNSLQSHQHLSEHPERCQTFLPWQAGEKTVSGLKGDRQTS